MVDNCVHNTDFSKCKRCEFLINSFKKQGSCSYNAWCNSSPSEKLLFYSKSKLIILARRKNIPYSKKNKLLLTYDLSKYVCESDFPIR